MEPSGSASGLWDTADIISLQASAYLPLGLDAPSLCGNWSRLREESNKCIGNPGADITPKIF